MAPPRISRARRLSAWVAMLAVVVFAAALAWLVFTDLWALLLVLASLAVAVGLAWFGLTRRGASRRIGVAGAACALAVGAVGVVMLGAVGELVALGASFAVFCVATRRALSADPKPPQVPTTRARSKAVLLMNPLSGDGKVGSFDLPSEARQRGVEPIVLQPGDDLHALAVDAARKAEVIGMAGGDGSQALVAEVAMEHDVAYVCVPAGTRNHLALDLGLDRDDVVGALDGFTDGVERSIDLAFVNDRVFVNNVSLGIYAEIVKSDAYRAAKRETAEKLLPELLGPRAEPFDLRFTGPDGGQRTTAQLILVSNNPYVLDRLTGIGSRPRLDSGELGIIALEIAGSAHAGELIALELLGQVRRFSGWLEWAAAEFEVQSGAAVATGIDGESVVLDPPVRFRIAPAALRVRVPPSAGIRSAPALSGSELGELWRIATTHG